MHQVLNGYADDEHVVVYRNYTNKWAVFINSIEHIISKVDTLRDGGTKILHLQKGHTITIPVREDREPSFNNEVII